MTPLPGRWAGNPDPDRHRAVGVRRIRGRGGKRGGKARRESSGMGHIRPGPLGRAGRARYHRAVVIFFEILLGLASLLIVWFALYTIYRLVTDES